MTAASPDPAAVPTGPQDPGPQPTGQALLGDSVEQPNRYAVPLGTLVGGAVVHQADHVVLVDHDGDAVPPPGPGVPTGDGTD